MQVLYSRSGSALSQVEQEIPAACKSLPFTLVFFFTFNLTQWFHRDVAVTFPMTSNINDMVWSKISESSVATESNTTDNVSAVPQVPARRLVAVGGGAKVGANTRVRYAVPTSGASLESVFEMKEILPWIEATLIRLMWKVGGDGKRVNVLDFNQMIGGVRLKLKRRGIVSCPGLKELHAIRKSECYGSGGEGAETPIGQAGLDGVHGFTANEYGQYNFWLDAAQDRTTVTEIMGTLYDNRWLSKGVEELSVQTVLYNVQIAFFVTLEIRFVLNPDGSIVKYASVRSLPTVVYKTWGQVFGDIFVLLLLCALGLSEIWRLVRACRKGFVRSDIKWYNVLNWAVVFVGIGFTIFFSVLNVQLKDLANDVGSTNSEPIPKIGTVFNNTYHPALVSDAWAQRHKLVDELFDRIIRLTTSLRLCELSTFWYSLLIMVKFFQAFTGHSKLSVLTDTLWRAVKDVSWFMVIFLLVFLNFILGAYFIYGHQLKDWSNLSLATNSAFRTLMGDFDFASMYKIAPISAMVWFYAYMCLFYLVMLNMMLAIIMDTYSVVKEEADEKAKLQNKNIRNTITKFFGRNSCNEPERDEVDLESPELALVMSKLGVPPSPEKAEPEVSQPVGGGRKAIATEWQEETVGALLAEIGAEVQSIQRRVPEVVSSRPTSQGAEQVSQVSASSCSGDDDSRPRSSSNTRGQNMSTGAHFQTSPGGRAALTGRGRAGRGPAGTSPNQSRPQSYERDTMPRRPSNSLSPPQNSAYRSNSEQQAPEQSSNAALHRAMAASRRAQLSRNFAES
eukprot:TRINITY_DN21643_c0_g1_i2.p1 TRINITY_DN21643_c0_g1~~TRINITY_DN21643_c0_g1_i2.p1  ORF type:complete len:817 (+),score=120.17 TRINITY_DN21643_c0_g1_i2:87-2453(+)